MKDQPSQEKLNTIIQQTFGEDDGYYCANQPNLSYSRAVGKKLFSSNSAQFADTSKCDYLTCLNEMANPSVSDIYYDNNGACVALQQCNHQIGLSNNVQSYDEFGNKILTGNNNIDWTSDFQPNCTSQDAANQCQNYSGYVCTNGKLVDPNVYCNNNVTADSNGNCVCAFAQTGETQYYGHKCNLTRKNCNNYGIPSDNLDGILSCKCDDNSGFGGPYCNKILDIPQSLPSEVKNRVLYSSCSDLLLIPGPGVTFKSWNVTHGTEYPNQPILNYSVLYIAGGLYGITVDVYIHFKNDDSTTTITFNKNPCFASAGNTWMTGMPVLNNYYKQDDIAGGTCTVFFIGMNK